MIKKSFFAVLFVAMAIFTFGVAQAAQIDGLVDGAAATGLTMNVNPGGTGDALIYGYYNARGSFDFIKVVNTSTTQGVAAKVRFREGKNSNEVLDFAICLSPADQWTAWVVEGGAAAPATLVWWDNDTPTAPDPNGNNLVTDNFAVFVPFAHGGTGALSSVTIDDTKEGYFEIIGGSAWDDDHLVSGPRTVATPAECEEAALTGAIGTVSNVDVPNTLMGNAYIFNIADGAGTYAYNATPLANFRDTSIAISLASDSSPRLDDATDVNGNGIGLDEVNFVLTKNQMYAIYDLQTVLDNQTDIINTFPTKKLSIQLLANNGPFNDDATFDAVTGEIEDADGRCEVVGIRIFDDSENSPTTTTGFSPGEESVLEKCDEVSLITVGSTAASLLDSNLVQFNLNNAGFELGWLIENFAGTGRSTTINNATANGMPVIGYELQGFVDGYFTHMLPMKYTSDVVLQ
jgi:hypothetical protein